MIKVVWNGANIDYEDEKEAICCLFSFFSKKIKYESSEVAKENISQLCDMFVELFSLLREDLKDKVERRKYLNLIKKLTVFREQFLRVKVVERNRAVEKIFEFLLSLEGLSPLWGFGFSNKFKDKLKGNPEKQLEPD